MTDNELSRNIKRLRKKRQLTQEQLAETVGVSAQAVSKWESGGYPDPSLLPVIADSLGASIDELYGRAGRRLSSSEELKELRKYSELAELIADEGCMRVLHRQDGTGGSVFISRKALAQESGVSEETVDRVTEKLMRFGFVQEAQLRGGSGSDTIYRFSVPDRFTGIMIRLNEIKETESEEEAYV